MLHQYLGSYGGKKKRVVQGVGGYQIVQNTSVVIRGRDRLHTYCVLVLLLVTKAAHAFRGELEGEPRSKMEDGLSMRARILST